MAFDVRPFLFVGAALLVACTREADVQIDKRGGDVAISAPSVDGKPPCIRSVIITAADTDIADTPPLWELATAEPTNCGREFLYGRVPNGFTQNGPAPALATGKRYMVELSGPGWQGGRTFTMRSDDGPMATDD